MRNLRALVGTALLCGAFATGCRRQTEVVVKVTTMGGTPSQIQLLLGRTRPFNDNPAMLPPFVEAVLRGANLELRLTPQGTETALSILPPKDGPRDLTVACSAPGFVAMPDGPQKADFVEGDKVTVSFTLTALPPDAGTRDQAPAVDLAGAAPADLSAPPSDGPTGG